MKHHYVLKTLGLFLLSVVLAYSGFWLGSVQWEKKEAPVANFIEKAVYIDSGKTLSPSAIRIEIEVMDAVKQAEGQVTSVEFAGHTVPLKPPDPTGKRGTSFLQLLPGKYPLHWEVKNPPGTYPASKSFEKMITVKANEIGVYLLIKGEELFVEGENK